jgi:hypothetical protein
MPTTLAEDTLIYPIVSDLAACLCTEFASEQLCFCGIEPAQGVPLEVGGCDGGGCGAASVRLVRVFPSTRFPEIETAAICQTLLAAELVVSVYRCVPVGQDDGSGPTPVEYAAWAQQQYADMLAMHHAIRCCFNNMHPDVEYVLGEFTPLQASGGIAGGQWTLWASQEF